MSDINEIIITQVFDPLVQSLPKPVTCTVVVWSEDCSRNALPVTIKQRGSPDMEDHLVPLEPGVKEAIDKWFMWQQLHEPTLFRDCLMVHQSYET